MSSRKDRNSEYKKRFSGNTAKNADDFSDRPKGGAPARQKSGYHSSHALTSDFKDEDWDMHRAPWQYGSGPVWHAGDGSGPSSWQSNWGPRPGEPWDLGPRYTSFEGSGQGPHWNNYMRVPPVGMHMPFFQNQYMNSYPPRQCFSSWQGKNSREGRNRKPWATHFDSVVKNHTSDRSEIHSTDLGRHDDAIPRRSMESGRNQEYHEDSHGRKSRTVTGDDNNQMSTSKSRKNEEEDGTSPVRKDNLALSLKASEIIDKVLNKNKGPAKSTSQSTKEANEGVDPEGPVETDRSAALLIQAEHLCRDLREKRQLLRKEREGQEKLKTKEQKDKIDEKLSSLTQLSKSRMRGYINDESLFNSHVQVQKQRREQERSAARSAMKGSSLASHSATLRKGVSTTAVRQGPKTTLRPNLSGAFRVSRTSNKQGETLDRKNLVRLVNSPRSRKERMQVAQILQSHGRNIRAVRPKLNLESAAGDHGDDDDDEEPLTIDLENLPAEVQEELAELFNSGFEVTDLENGSADSDTPMEMEDLHVDTETMSDNEDKPEEPQPRNGQQINISFSSKVTDPIIIYSDDANEKSSPSKASPKLDQKPSKFDTGNISECVDLLPSPEKMKNLTSRYEKEDQYYHDLLDSIFSRSGKAPLKVKEEIASSDTDEEDLPYQEIKMPFQDESVDMDELSTDEQNAGVVGPACSSPKTENQIHMMDIIASKQMPHNPEGELQVSTLESHLAMLTSSPGSKRRQRSQLSSPDTLQMSPVGSQHKRPKVDVHSSPGPDTCVDQVLEISLQEEEVRVKIEETNSAIARLKMLLQQTQEQLQRRMQFRQEMLEREANLRSRRLQILKGAVADRITPQLSESSQQPLSLSQLEQSDILTHELSHNTEPDPKPDSSNASLKIKQDKESDKKEALGISIKQEPNSGVAHAYVDTHVQDKQDEPDTTVSQHTCTGMSDAGEQFSHIQSPADMETGGSDHELTSQITNTCEVEDKLPSADASSTTSSAKTVGCVVKYKTKQKKSKTKSRGQRRTSTGSNTVCIADSTEESVKCSSDTNVSNVKKEKRDSPRPVDEHGEGEVNEAEKQKNITMEYMGTLSGEATHMDLLKELAVNFKSMSQDTYVFLQASDIVGQKKSLSDSETVKIKQEYDEGMSSDTKQRVKSPSANLGKSNSSHKFQKPRLPYTGVSNKVQGSQLASSSNIAKEGKHGTDAKPRASVTEETDSDSLMSSINSKAETIASCTPSLVNAETEASSLVESDCMVIRSPAKKRSPRKQLLKVVPSSHPAIRKKFRKRKEKEAESNVLDSSTDSIVECIEPAAKDAGTRRKIRTNKDPAVKLLQAYLHAESSSDVDLLSGPEQNCEEGKKKGQGKEKGSTESRVPSDTYGAKLKKKKVPTATLR